LTFGIRKTKETVALPDEADMSSVSHMKDGRPLPATKARADTKVRGAHVRLYGGTLSVIDKIGRWAVAGQTKEVYFPYLVQWKGKVELDQPNSEIAIWNAIKDESPSLGDNCKFPPKEDMPNEEEAAKMAADHFKAYYHILAEIPGPAITFMGTKKALAPSVVPVNILTIIVSSCPSARAELI
jgi:hypothetical protein